MRNNKKLPEGWTAGIGETSTTYYDMWYHHDKYQIHIYWDKGSPYVVEFYEIEGRNKNGDPQLGHIDKVSKCDSLIHAEDHAWELMEEYN